MSERKKPLISVVVPYYDHGRHLHQTVLSALRAYSGPLEIIIVNDGSVESKAAHYLEAARALSPAVKVIAQVNRGLSGARNTGIANATGEFVQLLDSDDMLAPGKLDTQLEHFWLQPELSVSLTNYLLCDHTGTHFSRDGDPISRFDFSLQDFLMLWERGFSIPIHCALFRRNALNPNAFEMALKGKEDWVFWFRLANAGHAMSYVPVFGAIYRQHPASMSKSFQRMGENWLAAAELIAGEMTGDVEAFRKAAEKWHQDFYQPRILAAQAPAEEAALDFAQDQTPASVVWPPPPACFSAPSRPNAGLSIIVPVHNHYRYLPGCLASILEQQASERVEVILIDDASSDPRVMPLLQEFAGVCANTIVLANETNLGIAETQNRAARRASGKFLVFLDCDDALPAGALGVVEQALGPEVDYLFTDCVDVDAEGKRIRVARYGGYEHLKPSGNVAADLLDGMVASHLKVISREKFLALGGFDPRFGGVQDWELALKFAQTGARFKYVPRPLYLRRIHSASVTNADNVRQFWLTNVVRRRFATTALRPGLSDAEALARGKRAVRGGSEKEALVFREIGAEALQRAKEDWLLGNACVFEMHEGLSAEEIWVLREHNSYFDAVFAPDEASACAMLGFMWDHDALVLKGEEEA